MDQPDIAPLARRLAEENNVDWRRLRGSGDAGRVVERDVLEYLARVMAGDEAVDPTPEPVPEGMQAWPEADVRAGSVEAARDEVELTSTIEDDIFLFDESDSDDDVAAVAEADHAAPDGTPPAPPTGEAAAGAVFDRVDASSAGDPTTDDDLEEDLLIAGDGDPAPSAEDAAALDEAVTIASDPELPDLFGAADAGPRDADETPALFADEAPDAADGDAGWFGGPELGIEDDGAATEAGQRGRAFDDVPSLDEASLDVPSLDEPSLDEPTVDALSLDEPSLEEPSDHRDADVGAAAVGAMAPPVAGPQEHVPIASFADVPLLRHGHVWRRQVDLSALVAAQADLAGDLGRTEPVPLAAFLVRASQKAAAANGGAVALACLERDAIRCVRMDSAEGFAATVEAVERALAADGGGSPGHTEADLVVADLSEFGVDDAVVRVGAPVLSLGRVLIDNLSGGRRAYLAMSGDGADGADAAQLLARVAEMLEAPVRVVV